MGVPSHHWCEGQRSNQWHSPNHLTPMLGRSQAGHEGSLGRLGRRSSFLVPIEYNLNWMRCRCGGMNDPTCGCTYVITWWRNCLPWRTPANSYNKNSTMYTTVWPRWLVLHFLKYVSWRGTNGPWHSAFPIYETSLWWKKYTEANATNLCIHFLRLDSS